jgi:CRP/FNR family transcriptional regulator
LAADARRELGALSARSVKAKQGLLRQGDAVDGLYLVVSGSLRVYYITTAGREATLYRVEAGGTCVLALTSAFNEEPYPAWVDAGAHGASFVRVPSVLSRRLLAEEAAFRDFVFRVLSGRVVELMQTLEEAGSAELEQRVARYLIRHLEPDRRLRVTQIGIASDLGTAREVVSRALRSLAKRGLVSTGRSRIDVLDEPALRAYAGLSARLGT